MRCHLEKGALKEGLVDLPDEEAHYLSHVLRVRAGKQLEVFDGAGRTAPAEVISAGPRRVTLRVGPSHYAPRPIPRVSLIQAIPKGHRMDWLVEKAAELGVDIIQPIVCARGIVRPDPGRSVRKQARWAEIALSASRQCRRAWLPTVEPVRSLTGLLRESSLPHLLLLGDLDPESRRLRAVLTEAAEGARPQSVGIVIGPEGDLTDEEKSQVCGAGAQPVSLGRTVLRSETAALYALSAVRFALG